MSRWAEAFNAIRARDTVDSVDTVTPTSGTEPHSVNCVNSVSGGKGADETSPPTVEAEPDEPLWPEPGTPERELLDRKNAAIVAGLLAGYHRHRHVMVEDAKGTGR
jgi:hypothetical protein